MKKVLFVAVVAAFAMTSCKKKYTCCCDVLGTSTCVESGEKMKKSDAETWCNSGDYAGLSECELK